MPWSAKTGAVGMGASKAIIIVADITSSVRM
jgi:hypothetical protein